MPAAPGVSQFSCGSRHFLFVACDSQILASSHRRLKSKTAHWAGWLDAFFVVSNIMSEHSFGHTRRMT
jgi:hypothetical protein